MSTRGARLGFDCATIVEAFFPPSSRRPAAFSDIFRGRLCSSSTSRYLVDFFGRFVVVDVDVMSTDLALLPSSVAAARLGLRRTDVARRSLSRTLTNDSMTEPSSAGSMTAASSDALAGRRRRRRRRRRRQPPAVVAAAHADPPPRRRRREDAVLLPAAAVLVGVRPPQLAQNGPAAARQTGRPTDAAAVVVVATAAAGCGCHQHHGLEVGVGADDAAAVAEVARTSTALPPHYGGPFSKGLKAMTAAAATVRRSAKSMPGISNASAWRSSGSSLKLASSSLLTCDRRQAGCARTYVVVLACCML